MYLSTLALRRLSQRGISYCKTQKKDLSISSILVQSINTNLSQNPKIHSSSEISLASPEADFRFFPVSTSSREDNAFQGGKITSIDNVSFSSPESDFRFFSSSNIDSIETFSSSIQRKELTSIDNVSYASPESDFRFFSSSESSSDLSVDDSTSSATEISFTSPDADFRFFPDTSDDETQSEWSNELSFVSPEADYSSQLDTVDYVPSKDILLESFKRRETDRADAAYSLSYATPFSDFASQGLLNDTMKDLLLNASGQKKSATMLKAENTVDDVPLRHNNLPRSYEEAVQESIQARVITSIVRPFEICHVNAAWEGLCGFSKDESIGKSLEILQGPETDQSTVTSLMAKLHQGEEAGAIVTNYTKSGRKFRNRLLVAPLRSKETQEITHFIGVLKEISSDNTNSQTVKANYS